MTKRNAVLLSICALISASTTTALADQDCNGTVDAYYVQYDGRVYLKGPVSWRAVCSLNEKWDIATPEACEAWLKTIQSSWLSGRSIRVRYYDASGATCTSSPGTVSPKAIYGM